MPKVPKRKRGPKPTRKPRSEMRKLMDGLETQTSKQRRYLSGKVRKFIELAAADPLTSPNEHALKAGYRDLYIGEKLYVRYGDLIQVERARTRIGAQMELDEALTLCAERARTAGDPKVELGYVTLILRVHGALSDKPLSAKTRRQLSREAGELVSRVQRKLEQKPGTRARITAMLSRSSTSIAAEVDQVEAGPNASGASSSSDPIDVEARLQDPDPLE